jgi:hypothetical protein
MNFIESHTNKKIADSAESIKNTKSTLNNTTESYNNLIMEYLINFNETNVDMLIQDFINSLKNKVDGELVITILRKYSYHSENKLIILINKLIERKIITKEIINTKIELYSSNGEIDDISEECPIIHKFIEMIKK